MSECLLLVHDVARKVWSNKDVPSWSEVFVKILFYGSGHVYIVVVELTCLSNRIKHLRFTFGGQIFLHKFRPKLTWITILAATGHPRGYAIYFGKDDEFLQIKSKL
uniref:Dynein light chain 1 n=1 Tax=Schistocephalus solidus TaxID=70667 RepID=A0A0V0J399_SCHSO